MAKERGETYLASEIKTFEESELKYSMGTLPILMKKLFKEENYQLTRIRMLCVSLQPRFEFLNSDLVKLSLSPLLYCWLLFNSFIGKRCFPDR